MSEEAPKPAAAADATLAEVLAKIDARSDRTVAIAEKMAELVDEIRLGGTRPRPPELAALATTQAAAAQESFASILPPAAALSLRAIAVSKQGRNENRILSGAIVAFLMALTGWLVSHTPASATAGTPPSPVPTVVWALPASPPPAPVAAPSASAASATPSPAIGKP